MSDRFFCPDDLSSSEIRLEGTEAHHLLNVLRAKPGETVEIFDGGGNSATGVIRETGRKHALIELSTPQKSPRPRGLTLLTAVPKGDRFRWLVEKATELGVTDLVPIATERSVVSPRETKIRKMEQTVISACKQSRRNWLMSLSEMIPLHEALESLPSETITMAAHPGGILLSQSGLEMAESRAVVIGPEGGLTDQEVSLLEDRHAKLVSLGKNILRTETAAIAVAAYCSSFDE